MKPHLFVSHRVGVHLGVIVCKNCKLFVTSLNDFKNLFVTAPNKWKHVLFNPSLVAYGSL